MCLSSQDLSLSQILSKMYSYLSSKKLKRSQQLTKSENDEELEDEEELVESTFVTKNFSLHFPQVAERIKRVEVVEVWLILTLVTGCTKSAE